MDTLVALGSTTAFAYSTWALFNGPGGHVYFMEAAAIITLIQHGALARVARERARLRRPAPTAEPGASPGARRNADGAETEVPVAELRAGDLVVLRPAITCRPMAKWSKAIRVDEAMLTGESAPADKSAGSRPLLGHGEHQRTAADAGHATGEETALAHIMPLWAARPKQPRQASSGWATASAVSCAIVVAIALAAAICWGLAPDWPGKPTRRSPRSFGRRMCPRGRWPPRVSSPQGF